MSSVWVMANLQRRLYLIDTRNARDAMNAMDIGSQGVAQPHPWQQFGNSYPSGTSDASTKPHNPDDSDTPGHTYAACARFRSVSEKSGGGSSPLIRILIRIANALQISRCAHGTQRLRLSRARQRTGNERSSRAGLVPATSCR